MNRKSRKVKKVRIVNKKDDKTSNKIMKPEELSNKPVIIIPLLSDLENKVNETVIGQEQIVKSVCTKIYESICFPNLKNNILIVGKSGTGKTEIVRQIAKNLDFPLVIEDATEFTQEGYVGSSVNDIIYDILEKANGNIELAKRGIIFIDEIDKKATKGKESSDISKGDVLKSLLKIVEGTVIRIENPNYYKDPENEGYQIEFDTSNLIFIFGGAFEGIEKIKERRLKKATNIGFSSIEENSIIINNNTITSFTKEDLIEFGLPVEFVGRVTNIYETNTLTEKDLVKILKTSKESIFKKYENILIASKIELEYPENLFENIAKIAYTFSTGARELNSQVSYIFEGIIYDVLNNKKEYKKCILEEEILTNNRKYRWIS